MSDDIAAANTASETVETVTTEIPDVPNVPETTDEQTQQISKTFSQEEVDDLIGKRLARERRKWERDVSRPLPQIADVAGDAEFTPADVERAEKLIAQREEQRQQEEIFERFSEKEEEARDKYPDFDQVVRNPRIPISDAMAATIYRSDIGPEIAYFLGSNPEEARRIAKIGDPFIQAKEIGKIEAKLVDNPPAKKVSSAPPPIRPISSKSTATPITDTTNPKSVDSMSTSEWIENERKRQIRLMEQRGLK